MSKIYLDYAATTPLRAEVLDAMLPYFSEDFGNAASTHWHGQQARRALTEARNRFAEMINAEPNEIIFTGCGSESDNLAVRGAMFAARHSRRGNHLITSIIEHKAVLDTARQLRDLFGFDITVLPVDRSGRVNPEQVRSAIHDQTVLISIMAANNEIGTLQPLQEIGQIARDHGVLFHTDAIQSAAFTNWNMQQTDLDLVSFSPHKYYGPKGVGILYARNGTELVPPLTGGGQEDGLRAGTSNVAAIVGAVEAFSLAGSEQEQNSRQATRLRDRLIKGVLGQFDQELCQMTGHPLERLPNHASFAFKNMSGNELLMHLDQAGISASSGSACLSGDPKPSAILEALGLDSSWTLGGLRFTVGRHSLESDIDYTLGALRGIVDKITALSHQFS